MPEKNISCNTASDFERFGDDVNLLAMQMQMNQYLPFVTPTELWTIWSLVDSMCYDINGRDNQGVPPIIYAAKRGSVILIRLLLNYHADINAMSEIRETAVMAACRKQKIGAVKFLINRGAKLDFCDKSQFSALRWAATHGNVALVRLLVRHKASVRLDCWTPNSALEIALSYPTKAHAKIVLLLQRQLVVERRQLLEEIIKKKERQEIKMIKKCRRKMQREAQKAPAILVVEPTCEPPLKPEPERSPFALPIVPSLKRKKLADKTCDTRTTSVVSNTLTVTAERCTNNRQACVKPLERSSSLRELLETQLFAPPATEWKKVDRGVWRQVEVRPRSDTANQISTPFDGVNPSASIGRESAQATIQGLITSEAKWRAFMSADQRLDLDTETRHGDCWYLENFDN